MDRSQILSQKVDKEVRQLIGDLQMQVVVLRSMLAMQNEQQPEPAEPPKPQPIPPQPEQPEQPERKDPDKPTPEQQVRGLNGKQPAHEAL